MIFPSVRGGDTPKDFVGTRCLPYMTATISLGILVMKDEDFRGLSPVQEAWSNLQIHFLTPWNLVLGLCTQQASHS